MCFFLCLAGFASLAAAQPHSGPSSPSGSPADAEHAALALRVARAGDLNATLDMFGRGEIERVATSARDLSDAERAQYRRIGAEVLADGRRQIADALAQAYARRLTTAQLAAIADFLESPDGRAYTGAFPQVMPEIEPILNRLNLPGEIRTRFCRQTGKLCQAVPVVVPAGQ